MSKYIMISQTYSLSIHLRQQSISTLCRSKLLVSKQLDVKLIVGRLLCGFVESEAKFNVKVGGRSYFHDYIIHISLADSPPHLTKICMKRIVIIVLITPHFTASSFLKNG